MLATQLKEREPSFDLTKGVLIYLVVLGHLLGNFPRVTSLIDDAVMPVFFVISGYFSKDSLDAQELWSTVKKKTKTLLLPYLIWSGISLLANLTIGILSGSTVSIAAEALQIFLYARSVWFLLALYISACLFSLSIYWTCRHRKYFLPAQAVIWIVFFLVLPDDFLCLYKVKWLYPFLVFGFYLKKWMGGGKKLAKKQTACLILLLAPLVTVACLYPETFICHIDFAYASVRDIVFGVLFYIMSALVSVLAFSLARAAAKAKYAAVLVEIGTYSLDIYVAHMFFIKALQVTGVFDIQFEGWLKYAFVCVCAAGIVILIWLISKYILRRSKLYRWSIGLK